MGTNRNQFNVKLTDDLKKIVQQSIGPMGGTEAEVIRSIVIAWLSEKAITSDIIKKKVVNNQNGLGKKRSQSPRTPKKNGKVKKGV